MPWVKGFCAPPSSARIRILLPAAIVVAASSAWQGLSAERAGGGVGVDDGQAFEALRSVRKLAEVKRVFDRFAVDGMLTANEALQALTEVGCTAPRTHAGRYLRSRRFFGLRREARPAVQAVGVAASIMAECDWLTASRRRVRPWCA